MQQFSSSQTTLLFHVSHIRSQIDVCNEIKKIHSKYFMTQLRSYLYIKKLSFLKYCWFYMVTSIHKTDEILTVYLGQRSFIFIYYGFMTLAVQRFWRTKFAVKLANKWNRMLIVSEKKREQYCQRIVQDLSCWTMKYAHIASFYVTFTLWYFNVTSPLKLLQ